ncbi:MAG: hypothetical protein LH650_08000 [Chloroflexi bacterium]|nr:hypothetical protein [Chloroflexota bacterium]
MAVRTRGWPVASVFALGLALGSTAALAQAPSGSTAPSPAASTPIGWLGASEQVYMDDFSVPTDWEILEDELGRTAYEGGGLLMSVKEDGATVWDDHRLPTAYGVLRTEALVSIQEGAGAAGVACGSSLGLPRYLFAAVTHEAEWIFGRIIDGRVQVVDRGPIPGAVDESQVRVGIECASVPEEGGDRVLVTLDGAGVAQTMLDIPVGPYDAAALLVSADIAPVSALFDDMIVHTGDVYAPRSPERDPAKPSA